MIKKWLSTALLSGMVFFSFGQQTAVDGNLFSVGYASTFINGLYDGWYPARQLLKHGDFGIGAPSLIDGELTVLDGKIYHTRYTGGTAVLSSDEQLPYAVVCHFKSQFSVSAATLSRIGQYAYIDNCLTRKFGPGAQNRLYAIHIKGIFDSVRTRAFTPVAAKPYLPLSALLDKQHFFDYHHIEGDLVGFRIPGFLQGPHIAGYHFHFLSADRTKGGHIIDLRLQQVVIEVTELSSYTMELPRTDEFYHTDPTKDHSSDIRKVETGAK